MFAFLLMAGLAHGSDVQDLWVFAPNDTDKATLASLGLGFAEGHSDGWWRMHADEKSFAALERSGLAHRPAMRKVVTPEAHHSALEMVTALETLAADHPASSELIQVGSSVEGRPILALRLGRSAHPNHRMRVLGAHHGDETSSAEVSLQLAEQLLQSPAWTSLLDDNEVWVVPHLNPDGIELNRRYNANGVDLNRNYGFEWSETEFRPGAHPFSEPETRAIRALGDHISFGMGLSIHAGATNLGWVWNYTTDRTIDDTLLDYLASSYHEECETPGFYTTNGADWYVTNGDTNDWSYGRHGTLDFTLEVSSEKSPAVTEMSQVLAQHLDAIPTMLDWPWWIAGTVVDAETGLGLPAQVTIDSDSRLVTTDLTGMFSRPVSDGTWDLTVQAPGYHAAGISMDANDDPVTIALTRSGFSAVRPVDRHLPASGQFTLTGDAETVSLGRPGHGQVHAEGSGRDWEVNPELLAPGSWTLLIDALPHPRGLFVADDSLVRVDAVRVGEDQIELDIEGLRTGTKVWGLWGEARTPVPLSSYHATDVTLVVDVTTVPLALEPIDLILWTRGRQVAVIGLRPAPPEDPPEEEPETEEDTAFDLLDGGVEDPAEIASGNKGLSAGGCSTVGDYPGLLWLVSLLGLLTSRRTHCDTDGCL
jgi:carboxypeptidase T